MQTPRLSWEEAKVAGAWILSAGFAAVIAFLVLVRPIWDNAWLGAFRRNKASIKEEIAQIFEEEIARWDQASVDAGAALAVNSTLEHMAIELEKQGKELQKMSGYLQSMTGGAWGSPGSSSSS